MKKWLYRSVKHPKLDEIKGVLTRNLTCRPCPVALSVLSRACLTGFARRAVIIGTAWSWSSKKSSINRTEMASGFAREYGGYSRKGRVFLGESNRSARRGQQQSTSAQWIPTFAGMTDCTVPHCASFPQGRKLTKTQTGNAGSYLREESLGDGAVPPMFL